LILLYVAPAVGKAFFPSDSPTLSVAAVYASFAVTLFMRPIGSALFGNYADRHGRRGAMIVAVIEFLLWRELRRSPEVVLGMRHREEAPNDGLDQIPKICCRMSGHGQSRPDRGKQGHVGSLGGALDAVR
jgi:hypothetical protein